MPVALEENKVNGSVMAWHSRGIAWDRRYGRVRQGGGIFDACYDRGSSFSETVSEWRGYLTQIVGNWPFFA